MLLEATTAAAAAATTAVSGEENRLLTIIADSDIVIKLTLFILVTFSVISWAIILFKYGQIKSARRRLQRFMQHFWHAKSIDALMKTRLIKGPAENIFRSGITPLSEGSGNNQQLRIEHETKRTTAQEIEQLEYYLPFLATTASASPFIGLFGTVWGILNAFFELSAAGSSSLQVVGPRIAEALFVTAVGLAVAIPALVFYNIYINRIRLLSRDMEQFSNDLNHRIALEFFAA